MKRGVTFSRVRQVAAPGEKLLFTITVLLKVKFSRIIMQIVVVVARGIVLKNIWVLRLKTFARTCQLTLG